MGLAGVDNLEMSRVLGTLPEPIESGQEQVGALVSRRTARETDREDFGIELEPGLLTNRLEQLVLGNQVSCPQFLGRQAQGTPQTVIVFAPRGNVAGEEWLKWSRGPRAGVNAIGDGLDRHFRKHLTGSFAVLLGDSVDVCAQAQGQLRHVEGCPAARRFLQVQKILFRLQNALHQIRRGSILQIEKHSLARKHAREVFDRKTVVRRGHRSMGGEEEIAADLSNVLAADQLASLFSGFYVEQLQLMQT